MSAALTCSVRNAGDPWWITTFPEQTGQFHVLVQATPQANNMDAVIGISETAPSTWSHLAAIVRFAPSGVIDVRNGGVYTADVVRTYSANTTYIFRFDIDVARHTYSVRVKPQSSSVYTTLASNYAFRTEQANVTSLAASGVFVDTTAPGALEICPIEAIADDTLPDGCLLSTPSNSFQSAWFGPLRDGSITHFAATPSTNTVDGVIGYTLDPADSFSDYIASVRFSTAGQIEARDGDVYRATNAMPYVAGHTYNFYVALDYTTKLYSVYATDGFDANTYTLLAKDFRFRPQQANADASLFVASIVDSSEGEVRTCALRETSPHSMMHVRSGNYRLAPFRDGRIVISDDAITQVLDNTGKTLASAPLSAQMLTVDPSGNIYLATMDGPGTTLTVTSVTETLQPLWTRSYSTGGSVQTMGAYDNGDIVIATAAPGVGVGSLFTIRPDDGTETSRLELASDSVGIGRDRFALSYSTSNAFVVEMHAPDGTLLWERRWTGIARANEIAVEPSGSVVFGGDFGGTGIDFGAGFYEAFSGPEFPVNGYMVALTNTGALRFAHRYFEPGPTSVSSSGDIMAIATTRWSQMPHPQLWVYTRDGVELHAGTLTIMDEGMGHIGQTIVDSGGRVIANNSMKLHPSGLPPMWPVLATFVF